jgi:hypothetical protein
MRPLLFSLLFIATATAAAATVLYSKALDPRPAIKPFAISDVEYRFSERFCRTQYNNSADRNACMMQTTGAPLQQTIAESDDR